MTEEKTDLNATTGEPTDERRGKSCHAHQKFREVVDSTADYIRTHPWISVTAAAFVGGILTAMCHDRSKSIGSLKSGNLREWLEAVWAKSTAKKQVHLPAIPDDLVAVFKQIKSKLHLPE
jgi:hypothetical protein